jgi:hypothetical protein
MEKIMITKEFLLEQHINQQKSIYAISKEFNIPYQQIKHALNGHKIPINYQLRKKRKHKYDNSQIIEKLRKLDFELIEEFKGLNIKTGIKCFCGKIVQIEPKRIINQLQKSCGCLHNRTGEQSPSWKGYKEISFTKFSSFKENAKKRQLIFTVTIEDIWEQYISQNRKCALSGDAIYWNTHRHDESTASLDRIDSNKGYTKNNIQIVHKDINCMKSNFNQQYFINTCFKIWKYNNENKDN